MKKLFENYARLSLKYKFVIFTTTLVILLMLIIGYIGITNEEDILYKNIEMQGKLLGETLSIPIINDLIYEKLGLVEEGGLLDDYIMEVFNEHKHDLNLLSIMVLDKDGIVISSNDLTQYGKMYKDPITNNILYSNTPLIQSFFYQGQPALDFGFPLTIDGERWGTLKIDISLVRAKHVVLLMVGKVVVFTLLLLLIGISLIFFLNKRFINPIVQLANTMEKANMDRLDIKVEVKGYDEIALLGKRFNEMIERIKQTNENLRNTHEKMAQSEKLASIGMIVSGIAHEINNPLGALFNSYSLLEHNSTNPSLREKHLRFIREGLERIANIINKLLWISKNGEHKPISLKVEDAINNVYPFVEYKLRNGKIQFIKEISNELSIFIDPHDFQQVLLNLFINAIHAMPAGGFLKIRGYKEDSIVKIEVIDTGTGIAHENIRRIFDPFFTTKPPGEGTGLGLWLSYEIIRNYNGEITVESELGKGSRFIISFPVN
jgi:signal transduction histidine kinase